MFHYDLAVRHVMREARNQVGLPGASESELRLDVKFCAGRAVNAELSEEWNIAGLWFQFAAAACGDDHRRSVYDAWARKAFQRARAISHPN